MKKNLTHIGNILTSTLEELRPAKDTEMTRIWSLWSDAVGEAIAKESQPAAFRDHTLIVHVSCSVWLQHLTFSKQEIIRSLNRSVESDLVKEIRFKIAALHK